jgi:carbonic anhydrase
MITPTHLLDNNRAWSARMTGRDPDFFRRLSRQQAPRYLWIGCADSRVPANEIVGLEPGELFVHRNVANVVIHTDLNLLSVLQFAVDVLQVEHVIVCGHYGCGGVTAAYQNASLGLVDNWLRHIQDVCHDHARLLAGVEDEQGRIDLLCALNVLDQALNVCQTTVIQDAWKRGAGTAVHAWIYSLDDGLLRDLGFSVRAAADLSAARKAALAAIAPVACRPGL